jgi:methylmalonyl-CoA mutase cobalamin-binding subunit
MKGKILGAALGSCVHVGGLHAFLKLAEQEGYEIVSLGPAVSVDRLVEQIQRLRPEIVAVSYRLTPEAARALFAQLKAALVRQNLTGVRLLFGGTPPVAQVARQMDIFDRAFDGTERTEEIVAYLRGRPGATTGTDHADTLLNRIADKQPYPLLRHHFGRPTVAETIEGARLIAEAGALDVLSLGTDQNAQQHFFHPEEMDRTQDGAGGVPVRTAEDLRAIYEATRCGNFPLLRCYSGTRDLIRWAEMSVAAIQNAWAAIPLCWYSVMDGRSTRPLREAIAENQQAMRWYAERGIPVEVNEAHQWSLRDAHDALAVTMAFLAAYNARKAGVEHYVAQYMFNTPPGTSAAMDIAKMLAKQTLIESLQSRSFTTYREVRAGIAHFSPDPSVAKGQGAAAVLVSLALAPHILHVVGFSEGDHAARPEDVIESCSIARGVLRNCLHGLPDMTGDPAVIQRKESLISGAHELLDGIREFGAAVSDDPWSDPRVLAEAIKIGLLDAPHFRGNSHLCGAITTRLIDGAWYAIDEKTGEATPEKARVQHILSLATPLR